MMIWRESRLSPISPACPACPACPASPASPASAGGPFYIESSYNIVRILNWKWERRVLLVLRREKQREI